MTRIDSTSTTINDSDDGTTFRRCVETVASRLGMDPDELEFVVGCIFKARLDANEGQPLDMADYGMMFVPEGSEADRDAWFEDALRKRMARMGQAVSRTTPDPE